MTLEAMAPIVIFHHRMSPYHSKSSIGCVDTGTCILSSHVVTRLFPGKSLISRDPLGRFEKFKNPLNHEDGAILWTPK